MIETSPTIPITPLREPLQEAPGADTFLKELPDSVTRKQLSRLIAAKVKELVREFETERQVRIAALKAEIEEIQRGPVDIIGYKMANAVIEALGDCGVAPEQSIKTEGRAVIFNMIRGAAPESNQIDADAIAAEILKRRAGLFSAVSSQVINCNT